ncbi:hypothetical protein LZ31DRAFT_113241 [Colletotrichum somersetense]|nr:hypothetical protein LZ31DRAFT_113241 [Colletotrichum somersetense]
MFTSSGSARPMFPVHNTLTHLQTRPETLYCCVCVCVCVCNACCTRTLVEATFSPSSIFPLPPEMHTRPGSLRRSTTCSKDPRNRVRR